MKTRRMIKKNTIVKRCFLEKGKILLTDEQKGFTLLEVMIATSLMVVIMGGVVAFSMSAVNGYMRNKAEQRVVDDARYAIEQISKVARVTSGNPESGEKLEFAGTPNADGGYPTVCFLNNQLASVRYCFTFNSAGLQASADNTPGVSGDEFLGNLISTSNVGVRLMHENSGFYPLGDSSDDVEDKAFQVVMKTGYIKDSGALNQDIQKSEAVVQSIISVRSYSNLYK